MVQRISTLQVMLHMLHGCAPTSESWAPNALNDYYARRFTRPAALFTFLAQVVSLGMTATQLGHMVQAWPWLLHTRFIPVQVHVILCIEVSCSEQLLG